MMPLPSSRIAPLILAMVLSAKAVMIALLFGGDFADQLLLAARYTARASFALFLVTYSASSLLRLWPGEAAKALVRHRRQWGLGFALVHTVHLCALAWYNIAILNMPSAQALLGGGSAYALMFAMAATSNAASMRAMGVWWKRLHTLGIHWLWFIFAFSYFSRIFDPARMEQGVILFSLCMAALGLRLAARFTARRPAAV